jgi:Ni/Co efflux regulator RcnB
MLRKISIVLSAVAVLGFAVSTADAQQPAQNKTHVNKNVTVHRNTNVNRNATVHRNVTVNRNVNHGNFVVGRTYNGHVWYGRNRHHWHGQWYAYGVGPCWINVDGNWFWNVLACP